MTRDIAGGALLMILAIFIFLAIIWYAFFRREPPPSEWEVPKEKVLEMVR